MLCAIPAIAVNGMPGFSHWTRELGATRMAFVQVGFHSSIISDQPDGARGPPRRRRRLPNRQVSKPVLLTAFVRILSDYLYALNNRPKDNPALSISLGCPSLGSCHLASIEHPFAYFLQCESDKHTPISTHVDHHCPDLKTSSS
jgi:hypothetical protein